MRGALATIFFLSGAASLLFETLWFRLSGIVFGNSAWASAIVLGSFMAGLAIGNALSTRLKRGNALRVYATLELTIAVSGLALVLVLPHLSQLLAPLFRALLDSVLLNAVRLIFAFVLLAIPATVMGATLPVVVSALSQRDPNFGRVLGLLYGCNTIGAVVGALAGELLLIRVFGVRGTGVVAALGSMTAAAAAFSFPVEDSRPRLSGSLGQPRSAVLHWRFLIAAACSGFALLALEVIWFRFVILFVMSTSITFAMMLAVVLAGIGIGALAASAALTRFPDADRFTPVIAAAAVVAVVLSYTGFSAHPAKYHVIGVIADSVRLMLPVSLLSGVLFTFIGRAVERVSRDEMSAAAMTTFANTVGAAIGPLVAGFVMIPTIGIERSLFVIGVLYLLITIITMNPRRLEGIAAGVIAILTLAFFPFHLFDNYFLPDATREYTNSRIVAVREGPIETAVVLRRDYEGEPYIFRLFTNGYSMSGTTFASKRYMSDFVYLPLALRPDVHNALLISYGVGVTAKRLTESRQIASIDVVDISQTILHLSSIVWPGRANPLTDPRVRVHIEDGRFFLLATRKQFDLITAEPPPPKAAGIVNLYTREHFRLMRDRLSERGIASYWLPAYQLSDSDNKAVIRAFCDVFTDCSLWSGAGAEWILIGSRGAWTPPAYADFARQWRDPVSGDQLRRVGIESPEQLGATFLADASTLRRITAAPLTDDHPLRLSPQPVPQIAPFVSAVMDAAPQAFARSGFLRTALPAQVRQAAPKYFASQRLLDRLLLVPQSPGPPPPALIESVLTRTDLRTLPRILFNSDAWLEAIAMRARARGDRNPALAYVLAVGALSDRDYARAASLFAEAERGMPADRELPAYQKLADRLSR